jgi:hypothetical protein
MSLPAGTTASAAQLLRHVADCLRVEPARLSPLQPPKSAADNPTKLLLRDHRGAAEAVVLFTSNMERDLVSQGVTTAAAARRALGARLGSVILEPIQHGNADGISYALYPYHRPITTYPVIHRAQVIFLRPRLLQWLREATAATARPAQAGEIDSSFRVPLAHLGQQSDLSARLRSGIARALDRLDQAAWSPRVVLAHNDLWHGNVLFKRWPAAARETFPFVIIDWPGAKLAGHAFFDLMRLSRSTALPSRRFRQELLFHSRLLACQPQDIAGYVLAALGAIDMDRGCFEREQFVTLAENSFATLADLLKEDLDA